MRKLFVFLAMSYFSISSFAFATNAPQDVLQSFLPEKITNCPQSLLAADAGFCPSFESVAKCQCNERAPDKKYCKTMDDIYNYMISVLSTRERACKSQKDTDYQVCLDEWNCFRDGGRDSKGQLCSTTGNSCR